MRMGIDGVRFGALFDEDKLYTGREVRNLLALAEAGQYTQADPAWIRVGDVMGRIDPTKAFMRQDHSQKWMPYDYKRARNAAEQRGGMPEKSTDAPGQSNCRCRVEGAPDDANKGREISTAEAIGIAVALGLLAGVRNK